MAFIIEIEFDKNLFVSNCEYKHKQSKQKNKDAPQKQQGTQTDTLQKQQAAQVQQTAQNDTLQTHQTDYILKNPLEIKKETSKGRQSSGETIKTTATATATKTNEKKSYLPWIVFTVIGTILLTTNKKTNKKK